MIEPKYKNAGRFSEGLWAVQHENGLSGYVDSADNVIIAFQYATALEFKNNMAFVHTESGTRSNIRERLWGLIDKRGRYLIEPRLGLNDSIFCDVATSSLVAFRTTENKYGFLNLSGDVQIPAVYDEISILGIFSEGKAAVRSGQLWGIIDTKGEWIVPPAYRALIYYWKGHIPFLAEDEDLWGFLDAQGNIALEPKYTRIHAGEGPWVVELEGKKGVLDENLKIVVAPKYEGSRFRAIRGSDYLGGLSFMDDSGVYKALDTKGNELFAFPERLVEPISAVDGYYVLRWKITDKYFLVEKGGKMLLPPEFEYIHPNTEGIIPVKKGKLWGLVKLEQ